MSSSVEYLTGLIAYYKEAAKKCRVDLSLFEASIVNLEEQLREITKEPETVDTAVKPRKNLNEKEEKKLKKFKGKVIRLTTEEKIADIIVKIDKRELKSPTSSRNLWSIGKYHPHADCPQIIIDILRNSPERTLKFEDFLLSIQSSSKWKKTYDWLNEYLRELKNQGIIELL